MIVMDEDMATLFLFDFVVQLITIHESAHSVDVSKVFFHMM